MDCQGDSDYHQEKKTLCNRQNEQVKLPQTFKASKEVQNTTRQTAMEQEDAGKENARSRNKNAIVL